MKVLLLGATGFSGREVLQELLREGHIVTATTRNEKANTIFHSNLTVVQGNVQNKHFIQNVLSGQDAVINCLGIGGKGNGEPNSFISDTTEILVKQMEQTSIPRLICMSNVGAGDSIRFQPWIFTKLILPYFMKWLKVIIEDKNRMESIITKSTLNWTIVRFPNIVDKPPKNKITATLDGKGLKMSITNQDAASFLVAQLTSNAFTHRSPSISN